MRRLFIIRKDLHLTSGKLAAMIGHCCEAYWTNLMKAGYKEYPIDIDDTDEVGIEIFLKRDVWDQYVNGIFTKTICEARNLYQLMKSVEMAEGIGLIEGKDFGLINDRCLTELTPENPDGSTTVGVWFRPLPDDIAHQISKKYPLLRDHTQGGT